jgi:hypothetical protein
VRGDGKKTKKATKGTAIARTNMKPTTATTTKLKVKSNLQKKSNKKSAKKPTTKPTPAAKSNDSRSDAKRNAHTPSKSKSKRIFLNLHRKYQIDGACILEHWTNFSMSQEGKHANDLFASIPGSCVTAAHNSNESIRQCQQGGTMVAAFSQLAGFIEETGSDRTGLGRWSWIKVGTGEYSTWIISMYQPCNMAKTHTSTLDSSGKMKQSRTVWAQHVRYLRKKGIFHDPRKAFCCQLITQLKHWRAKGDEIVLFADLNENVYTGQMAKLLQGDDLFMSE